MLASPKRSVRANLPLQAMAVPATFDDGWENDNIEQLLREATNSYLRQGEVPLNSWDHARNSRTRAIQMARKRAVASRTRRPAKQTRPRPSNYETDISLALLKYEIPYPHTLQDVACYLRDCHHRDAARALRILFVNLLFGSGRFDDVAAQILLEESLNLYGLNHLKSAFLLAMHKHFDSTKAEL